MRDMRPKTPAAAKRKRDVVAATTPGLNAMSSLRKKKQNRNTQLAAPYGIDRTQILQHARMVPTGIFCGTRGLPWVR